MDAILGRRYATGQHRAFADSRRVQNDYRLMAQAPGSVLRCGIELYTTEDPDPAPDANGQGKLGFHADGSSRFGGAFGNPRDFNVCMLRLELRGH